MQLRSAEQFKKNGARGVSWGPSRLHRLCENGKTACGRIAKVPTQHNDAVAYFAEFKPESAFACRQCKRKEMTNEQASKSIETLVDSQGWTEETELRLLRQFIADGGYSQLLLEFLRAHAASVDLAETYGLSIDDLEFSTWEEACRSPSAVEATFRDRIDAGHYVEDDPYDDATGIVMDDGIIYMLAKHDGEMVRAPLFRVK